MENKIIYTIGYTLFQNGNNISIDALFSILNKYNVDFLVDVRSVPYSKQYPECTADNLKFAGQQFGIRYIHMPEVGAKTSPQRDVFSKAIDIFYEDIFPIPKSNRPEHTALMSHEEIVDFNKFRNDKFFNDGLNRIETAYKKNFTLALMCSEKNPIECHRYFLISKALEHKNGEWLEIRHIVKNSKGDICTITNSELDAQLKETVFKRKEIINLSMLSASLIDPEYKIEKYYGETLQEKIIDFCDRYWNLMHGWKRNLF